MVRFFHSRLFLAVFYLPERLELRWESRSTCHPKMCGFDPKVSSGKIMNLYLHPNGGSLGGGHSTDFVLYLSCKPVRI